MERGTKVYVEGIVCRDNHHSIQVKIGDKEEAIELDSFYVHEASHFKKLTGIEFAREWATNNIPGFHNRLAFLYLEKTYDKFTVPYYIYTKLANPNSVCISFPSNDDLLKALSSVLEEE